MKNLFKCMLISFLLLGFTLHAQEWTLDIQIDAYAQNDTITQIRTLGGHPAATHDFDSGLDIFLPPAGFNFYSYFQIDAFPNLLSQDIRPWQTPYQDSLSWELILTNTSNIDSIKIHWDPSSLPEKNTFFINQLELKQNNSIVLFQADTLHFTYVPRIVNLTLLTNPTDAGVLIPPRGTYTYFEGDTVQIEAHSSQYFEFGYWANNGNTYPDSILNIIMDNDKIYRADYNFKKRSLTYIFEEPGWYCLSFPLILENNHVVDLFPTLDDSFAYTWNIEDQTYLACDTIGSKKGYFLAIAEPDTVTLTGDPVYQFTDYFTTMGWHLVGANLGGCPFTDPNDNPDGYILSPAYIWQSDSAHYTETDSLQETLGSWIAVTDACEWIAGNTLLNKATSAQAGSWQNFIADHGALPPNPPLASKVPENKKTENAFRLYANYPNPFNPATTISYTLPEKSNVNIQILDLLGRVVDTLVEENQSAGFHQIEWNTSLGSRQNLASGIYFLQINAGKYHQIQKLTLIK